MQIITTSANGHVAQQIVDVAAAAKIGSILSEAESTIRRSLIVAGFDAAAANEIAIAAHEGAYAAVVAAGLLTRTPKAEPTD